jgi:tetratricopeptide (TPR) repeat protein
VPRADRACHLLLIRAIPAGADDYDRKGLLTSSPSGHDHEQLSKVRHRDDFKASVVRSLANRAGNRCSNPDCRRETSGPASTEQDAINLGVAAHITAAAPGGPRFDPDLSPAQRSGIGNAIWCCQSCGKLVDSDDPRFTKDMLLAWKAAADERARSLLETPRRPEAIGEPILIVPDTDPAVSWLPFSARAIPFTGRETEKTQLLNFIHSHSKASWMLIMGPGGSGKSRLALEVCHALRPGWNAGFLSRADTFTSWSHFRPSRPTLVVIDYVSGRAAEASAIILNLVRSSAYLTAPVRVLLVERELGSWNSRLLREGSQSECAEIIACRHDDPLVLKRLPHEAIQLIAANVASFRKIPWDESAARTFGARMRTFDSIGRPLFAMIAAAYPNQKNDPVFNPDLLAVVLKKEAERRHELISDDERRERMENLATLATLVGGLPPRSGGFDFLAQTMISALLPNADLLDRSQYRDFVAGTSTEATLVGFQPDILGERMILNRLKPPSGVEGVVRKLLIAAWHIQPDDLCDFILRVADDFPGDQEIVTLCDLPRESADARFKWGWLVGDLIRVVNRSDDPGTGKLLKELEALALASPGEPRLQMALARAEFHLGNVFLFADRDYGQASARYDDAIRHGVGTQIEASVINNRGILKLHLRNEDEAFADWSAVIDNNAASDEVRACSFNNRADIFAERDLHLDAIRDRSEVLALKETSPDRRYIAFVRRSESYKELGMIDEALGDLTTIQAVDDISPEQKSEARFQRGMLYKDLDRLSEAREDLEAVCSTDELFSGVFARAVVGLGDLARLSGDLAGAREYLDVATNSEDADEETLVEALIVWARVLTDQGHLSDAENTWQSVLSNPAATARQRSIATSRRGPAANH